MKRYILLIMCICCTLLATAQTTMSYSVNPFDYEYSMTIYAAVKVDGSQLTSYTGYQVAAFVGSECRGVGSIVTANGTSFIYLRAYSNLPSGETLSFRIYNGSKQLVMRAKETIPFADNGAQNTPSNPLILSTKSILLGDVNNSNDVTIDDVAALVSYLNGTISSSFNANNADANQDDGIDTNDVDEIVNIILGK